MRLIKPFACAAILVLAFSAMPVTAEDTPSTLNPTDFFTEILNEVKTRYVEPVSDSQLAEAAVKGMLGSLDPHSSYMDAKEFRELQVQTRGEFGGLGLEISMENNLLTVVSPIDDTPAAKAGMKTGDVIVAIDGSSVADMTLSEAVERMRGAVGSPVKLTIRRGAAEPFDVPLVRAEIKVDSVKSRLEAGNIGYVRISSFSERTSSGLEEAIASLKLQAGGSLTGLVLDLRNDPGGLLDQAIQVANDFLDQGGIVSTRGRTKADDRRYDARPNHDLLRGVPVVVLINGGSASASEIVAGALKDDHRAILLGTRSFGKGSVQTIIPVSESGGAMRLTTARYYTPSGHSIQAKGIEPDIVVEPAKIERVAVPEFQHEADLRGALPNPDAPAKKPAKDNAAPKDTIAPGASAPEVKPQPSPTAAGAAAEPASAPAAKPGAAPQPDPGAIAAATPGDPTQDYQLSRALDLLRGAAMFRKLAQR